MRVSSYTEWSYHLGSIEGFLWVSTSSEKPRIVKVDAETHRILLNERDRNAIESAIAPGPLADLIDAEIVVHNELSPVQVIWENSDASRNGRILRRVVLPSARCPHGCGKAQFGAYCGQIHSKKSLSFWQQEHFLAETDELLGNGKYDTLSVAFFGAEPLTEISITESLLAACRQLAERRSAQYLATIVTSGLLLTKTVAFRLHRAGLANFEVTVDGQEACHDARRPTAGGAPTFRKIIENLRRIVREPSLHQLTGTIRMNVDQRNRRDAIPLFKYLRDEQLWPRLGFYIAPIRDWGAGRARQNHGIDPHDFGRLEIDLFAEQLRSGAEPTLLPGRKRVVCTAVRAGSSVVDPFGKRHSCTETPLSPGENPFASDNETEWNAAWTDTLIEGKVPCRSCNLLPVCGGACPKDWLLGRVPCPSFRYNFKERIQIAHLFEEARLGGQV